MRLPEAGHLSYNKQLAVDDSIDRPTVCTVSVERSSVGPACCLPHVVIPRILTPPGGLLPGLFFMQVSRHGSPQGRDRRPAERRQVVAVQLARGPADRDRRRHVGGHPRPGRGTRPGRRRGRPAVLRADRHRRHRHGRPRRPHRARRAADRHGHRRGRPDPLRRRHPRRADAARRGGRRTGSATSTRRSSW